VSDTLLATKIRIPPLRRSIVNRSQLIQRLNDGISQNHRLTLVSAPAGYGKSTLLSEWVSQLDIPVAWLSLEKGENTPTHFWNYFGAALDTIPHLRKAGICESLFQAFLSPQPPLMDILLTNLINELTKLTSGALLVLDDLHAITEGQIHHDLIFLIDHLPQTASSLHLVVASRMDPPWPLARWRARGEINEIRASDLRFNLDEIGSFLSGVMELTLTAVDISELEERTEGWIAGLQMAALSMHGKEDIAGFLEGFTGSHRFVLDYLLDEVLAQQDPRILDFLLKTSILDRLCDSLCNAVTQYQDCQATLLQLEKANMFLIALDDERRWYRYHHLFSDLLRNQLNQKNHDLVPELHHRASEWYWRNYYLFEAISHAIEAGDYELAADIVEHNIIAFKDHDKLPEIVHWLEMFPEPFLCTHPWLCVAKSWVLAYLGNSEQTRVLLKMAERTILDSETTETSSHIRGHIAAIHCYLLLFDDEIAPCIEKAYEALACLPETDHQTRISTLVTLSSALRLEGNLLGAMAVLEEAITLSRRLETTPMTIRALCALSSIQAARGGLSEAIATLNEAIRLSERGNSDGKLIQLPAASIAYIRLGDILYRRNNVEQAFEYVQMGVKLAEKWGMANAIWEGYMTLAGIATSQGDYVAANQAMQHAKEASQKISARTKSTDAFQVELWLVQGMVDEAAAWVDQQGLTTDIPVQLWDLDRLSTFVHVMIAQNDSVGALKLLSQMLTLVEKAGEVGYDIAFSIDIALAYLILGKGAEATEALIRAVKAGEKEGYSHVFIDHGQSLRPLLREIYSREIAVGYVMKLLSEIDKKPEGKKQDLHEPPQHLIEPLSERELQVLRLLETSLTSVEISRELFISVNTTRTHIRNIYGKLAVHGRIEAIQKAKGLNLI
jgi:LuxR family maltose regulon positive regulatory protein